MGIPVKDLDKTEAWGTGTILPPGRHIASIIEADDTKRSSGGHPQIELKLGNDQGTIMDWIVVIDSTMGKVRQMLEAFGFDVEGMQETPDVSRLVGRKALVHVAEQPSRKDPSKTISVVAGYEPTSSQSATTLPADTTGLNGDSKPIPF